MITSTVICILISIFLFYSLNYVSDSKYYIINKYKDTLINHYEFKLNSTISNKDLKKNIMLSLKDIIFVIIFLDFDAFIDNQEKFTNMNNYGYNLLKDVTKYHTEDEDIKYIISISEFRHYYFNLINSNLTNIIHKEIDKYMSKYFFELSETFFKIFNLNIKNYHKLNINSKYDLDKIFFQTLNDDRLISLFNNTELFDKFKERINNIEHDFYCIQIINNKCNTNYHLTESKKIKIYDMFDFTGKYAYLNECCTY